MVLPPTPQDGTVLRRVMIAQASFYLEPVSFLAPHSQGECSIHRNAHPFCLASGEVMSLTQAPKKLMCSLESSGHFMKHRHEWIRTTRLTAAV